MKEKFIQFLKDNGALESFLWNIDACPSKWVKNNISPHIITIAFDWKETDEGWNYWNDLDNKWRAICKSN